MQPHTTNHDTHRFDTRQKETRTHTQGCTHTTITAAQQRSIKEADQSLSNPSSHAFFVHTRITMLPTIQTPTHATPSLPSHYLSPAIPLCTLPPLNIDMTNQKQCKSTQSHQERCIQCMWTRCFSVRHQWWQYQHSRPELPCIRKCVIEQ